MSALAGALITLSLVGGFGHQATGETIPAPAAQLSADGRTASDGTRTLTVSQAAGVSSAGQALSVTGSGYDDFKGIYVAFCLIPPTNQPPSPCGGGADQAGATGASNWISSNPPPYGQGLAVPYGTGGSFSVTVDVNPVISPTIDCRRVRCAIVTRNDHTRSTDRGQDIFVPIAFADPAVTGQPPATAPPPAATVPPATVADVPTTEAPPATTPVTSTTREKTTSTTTIRVEGITASTTSDDGGSSPVVWIVLAVFVIAGGAGATIFFVRRRAQAA